MRPHNPVLAGRCLDEAGLPAKPEDVTAMMESYVLSAAVNAALQRGLFVRTLCPMAVPSSRRPR